MWCNCDCCVCVCAFGVCEDDNRESFRGRKTLGLSKTRRTVSRSRVLIRSPLRIAKRTAPQRGATNTATAMLRALSRCPIRRDTTREHCLLDLGFCFILFSAWRRLRCQCGPCGDLSIQQQRFLSTETQRIGQFVTEGFRYLDKKDSLVCNICQLNSNTI